MILSKTPFRISLFGGGSDYPEWYKKEGGCSIGFSMDKYCYISARFLPPFFEHKFRIVYSVIELVNQVEDIKHPAAREVLKYLEITKGVELHHFGDLPARSGLGSSSAFTIGALTSCSRLNKLQFSKQELVEKSVYIEQELIKEAVGSQDQTLVCHGGPNFINFQTDGQIVVEPQNHLENWQELIGNLQLFFTGISRYSMDNAKKIVSNIDKKRDSIFQFMQMARETKNILNTQNPAFDDIGSMLGEAWQLKRNLADTISNEYIDSAYAAAMDAGALGGKVLGAGGGGFLLFYTPPERQENVRLALKKLTEVLFKLDTEGSRLVENESSLL